MIPFSDQTTINGYPCDVAISALQKFIRRGETELAAQIAYELARTSEEMREYLWKRLLIISVEDIGLGDPLAPVQIYTLNETRRLFLDSPGEFGMFYVHAVRYLCNCKKERGSCDLSLLVKAKMEEGGIPLLFPDFVYDRHTKDGLQQGRSHTHFLEEAAIVYPEAQMRDAAVWKAELLQLVQDESEETNNVIYSDRKTVHGYPCDVCISALQKFIRRGETEQAVYIAYELAMTGPFWLELVWMRLRLISVEDICLGNPLAQIVVSTLDKIRKSLYQDGGIHPMYFTHAIRYMCQSKKERGSCNLEHLLERKLSKKVLPLYFPDYVYDKHTERGIAMGRGEVHFLREAAKVFPQADTPDGEHWAQALLQHYESRVET